MVYLGRESQQGLNLNEVSRGLEEVIKHPDYDKNSKDNDICLLKLSSTVDFTNYIRPVCLAAPGSSFTGGTSCWVTGWGNIRSGGEYGGCRSYSSIFESPYMETNRRFQFNTGTSLKDGFVAESQELVV